MKDYKERYKKIAESAWFQDAYNGMSLGEEEAVLKEVRSKAVKRTFRAKDTPENFKLIIIRLILIISFLVALVLGSCTAKPPVNRQPRFRPMLWEVK